MVSPLKSTHLDPYWLPPCQAFPYGSNSALLFASISFSLFFFLSTSEDTQEQVTADRRKASTTRRTKKRKPKMMHGQKKTDDVGSELWQSVHSGAMSGKKE